MFYFTKSKERKTKTEFEFAKIQRWEDLKKVFSILIKI